MRAARPKTHRPRGVGWRSRRSHRSGESARRDNDNAPDNLKGVLMTRRPISRGRSGSPAAHTAGHEPRAGLLAWDVATRQTCAEAQPAGRGESAFPSMLGCIDSDRLAPQLSLTAARPRRNFTAFPPSPESLTNPATGYVRPKAMARNIASRPQKAKEKPEGVASGSCDVRFASLYFVSICRIPSGRCATAGSSFSLS